MIAQLAPGYYVHKADAISDLGGLLNQVGYRRTLIISGVRSYQSAQTAIEETLNKHQIPWKLCQYGGECSDHEAERILGEQGRRWDVVVGVGGGKVIDLSKLVAWRLSVPLVTIPTVVSNCAATTSNAVVYDGQGRVKESRLGLVPPLWALVDDTVLSRSPQRYLVSGLGDTLAKPYEARIGARGESVLEVSALSIATLAVDGIARRGVEGLQAMDQAIVNPVLSDLIDAVVLLGSLVGGIGGNLLRGAVAHALHNALTGLPELHHTLHGEKVAYGLMVQETVVGRSRNEILELRGVLSPLGLPVNWATLAGQATLPNRSVLREVAEKTLASPLMDGKLPGLSVDHFVDAIRQVEDYC